LWAASQLSFSQERLGKGRKREKKGEPPITKRGKIDRNGSPGLVSLLLSRSIGNKRKRKKKEGGREDKAAEGDHGGAAVTTNSSRSSKGVEEVCLSGRKRKRVDGGQEPSAERKGEEKEDSAWR